MKQLLILSLIALASPMAFANLPQSSMFTYVNQTDAGTNCSLHMTLDQGRNYMVNLVIDQPRYIIDSSTDDLFTLHQDGPDQTVLGDSRGIQIILNYAGYPDNSLLKSLQVVDRNGQTLSSCNGLSLIKQ